MIETMHKLDLLPNRRTAIIERLIDEIRDNNAFDDECYGDVLIAMTEAVNCAISTATNCKTTNASLNTNCRAQPLLQNHRPGAGFDFENVPDPTSPENIESPMGAVFSSSQPR